MAAQRRTKVRSRLKPAPLGFSFGVGEVFENWLDQLLQLAEILEVLLKSAVQLKGVIGGQFCTYNHVPQADGMRQEGLFIKFFQGLLGIVVIHEFIIGTGRR